MKNFSIILSTIATIFASAALIVVAIDHCSCAGFRAKAPVAPAPVEAAPAAVSGDNLLDTLKKNPKMLADAMEAYQQMQHEEQERALAEALVKYADDIVSDANMPSVGPSDAKLTVVEFYDFSCGFCKRLAPELEKVIAANPDVKFVFKPLTFVSNVSAYQAKAGYAAHKQGKFLPLYKAIMEAEGAMNEAEIDDMAKSLGLNMSQFKADLGSEDAQNYLNTVSTLAGNIQVNGVPAVFIGTKHIQAMSAEEIQKAIDEAK